MPSRSVDLTTPEGHRLEGRLSLPEGEPQGGAIVCHPHPLYGGSMSSSLVPPIQREIAARGWAALRFNFRGVGRSEGRYERGIGELKDGAAALDLVASEVGERPLAVVGWSFGALVGLAVAVADPRVVAYAGVAPPVAMRHEVDLPALPPPERLEAWRGRTLLVCGTEDPFCRGKALAAWAEQIPAARVEIRQGQDHFFSTGKVELAELVADFISEG